MVSKKEILEKIKQDMKRRGLDKQAAKIRPARKVRNFKWVVIMDIFKGIGIE